MVLAVGTRIDPPESGASTTNGTTGRTVSFSTALPDTDYHVSITPTADQDGSLGDYWYTKTVNNFVLYNDGAAGIAFTYAVTRY
jgi:hypothetical protein